ATRGGMGVTGVIVGAQIKLKRVHSAWVSVDTDRFEMLDDALAVLDGPGGTYRVAWLDLLSGRPVRGVVTRANPIITNPPQNRGAARMTIATRLTVPSRWPGGLLTPSTVRAFNEVRFRPT